MKLDDILFLRMLGMTLRTTGDNDGGADDGGADDGGAAGGADDGGTGDEGSHWIDSLDDEGKASVSGLTAEEAIARLTAKAPDSYELPEGMEVDEEWMGKYSEVFKEANLSQDVVGKLLALDAERMASMADGGKEGVEAARKAELDSAMTEMGKEKYTDMLGTAHAVMEHFGDEKIDAWLEETGLGGDLQMLRFISKIGERITEGGGPGGGGQGGQGGKGADSEEARLRLRYPSMYDDK